MRFKRVFCIALLVACGFAVLFCGCNKSVYGLSDGTYAMEKKQVGAPAVAFDLKDNTFQFTFDLLSSYANMGTIKIGDGKVIGTTNDCEFTYVFAIVDNDTIAFVEEDSSSTKTVEGNIAVPDGAEFLYVNGSSAN